MVPAGPPAVPGRARPRRRDRRRARARRRHPGVAAVRAALLRRRAGAGHRRRPPGSWPARCAAARGIEVPLPVLLVGGQAMVWLSWPFGLPGWPSSFAVTALAVLLWRMRAGAAHYVRDVTAGLFTAAYVPLFCSFATLLMVVAADGARPGAHLHDLRGRLGRRRLRGRACSPAGTRWPRRSARRSPGRASPARRSPAWLAGALCVALLLGGPWWAGALPARCWSPAPRSATWSSR